VENDIPVLQCVFDIETTEDPIHASHRLQDLMKYAMEGRLLAIKFALEFVGEKSLIEQIQNLSTEMQYNDRTSIEILHYVQERVRTVKHDVNEHAAGDRPADADGGTTNDGNDPRQLSPIEPSVRSAHHPEAFEAQLKNKTQIAESMQALATQLRRNLWQPPTNSSKPTKTKSP
jgi:hypothetical protein